jgi:outer membrane protein assembly factor BamB
VSVVASDTIVSKPLSLIPARAVWSLDLNNQLTVPPAYDQERAYFGIDGDQLVAYSLSDGAQVWLVSAHVEKRPTVGDTLLFCVEAGELVARRIVDGSVAWRKPIPDPLSVAPVWENGWLMAITTKGSVLMFRANDGQPFWTRDIGSPAGGVAAAMGDRLYIPTSDGRVVALHVETGEPVWERRLGGAANDILALDERLYVGSKDNFLYCLLTKNGVVDWRWRTGGDVIGMPAVDGDHIFFVSLDNVLRSLHRISGGQQWMRPLPVRPVWGPLKVVDRVVVGGQSSQLSAFDLKDGKPAGTLDAGAELAAAPHLVSEPSANVPVVLVVSRDIAKGAVARLMTRRLEPQGEPLGAPLPNVIKVGPQEDKR